MVLPDPGGAEAPNDGLVLRAGTLSDVGAIVKLVESAYRGEASRAGWTTEADLLDGRRTDVDAVTAQLEDPSTTIVCALRGPDLVGCCAVSSDGTSWHFGMFAVTPTLQGAGIGKVLLAEAERRVLAGGGRALELSVLSQRHELIAFYQRRGFSLTGSTAPFPSGDERFGVPRRGDLEFLIMAKALSRP